MERLQSCTTQVFHSPSPTSWRTRDRPKDDKAGIGLELHGFGCGRRVQTAKPGPGDAKWHGKALYERQARGNEADERG